jgi:hypothetical protein
MTAAALALLSALAFATATVVQHRAVSGAHVSPGPRRGARLVLHILSHPRWLAGQVAGGAGFALHALALRAGPVVLVQPLLSSGLVLALVLRALIERRDPDARPPSRGEWLAAATICIGLTVFLLTARPGPGRPEGRPGVLLAAALGTGLLAAGAWWWSRRPRAPHRSLALGVAAGVGFGVTGVLLKQVVATPIWDWWRNWPLAALLVVGAVSMPTAQAAYRAGALTESLPAMTALEPLVAVGLASAAFGESLAPGRAAHAGQLCGLLLLVVGVVSLARREASREAPRPG